jgi:hypothetical protein
MNNKVIGVALTRLLHAHATHHHNTTQQHNSFKNLPRAQTAIVGVAPISSQSSRPVHSALTSCLRMTQVHIPLEQITWLRFEVCVCRCVDLLSHVRKLADNLVVCQNEEEVLDFFIEINNAVADLPVISTPTAASSKIKELILRIFRLYFDLTSHEMRTKVKQILLGFIKKGYPIPQARHASPSVYIDTHEVRNGMFVRQHWKMR